MNIHRYKKKIKQANLDFKANRIGARKCIKRKSHYKYDIEKLREKKRKLKKK